MAVAYWQLREAVASSPAIACLALIMIQMSLLSHQSALHSTGGSCILSCELHGLVQGTETVAVWAPVGAGQTLCVFQQPRLRPRRHIQWAISPITEEK